MKKRIEPKTGKKQQDRGVSCADGSLQLESASARREFLATSLALAASGVALAAPTGTAHAANAVPAGGAVRWDRTVDVVVAGAGNGGVSAALQAASGGAKTLLVEISTQIGGNTLMSGGVLHTAGVRNWEDYNKFTFGLHDQVIGKVFVETFWNEYIPWLQSHNAYMSRPTPETPGYYGDWMLGHGEPGQLRHKLYFDSLMKAYHDAGGTTLAQTRVVKLFADDEGRVIGLRAKTWQNSPLEENQKFINIRARKTIMAIGGWIMDGEKKQKYLGQDGHLATNMCGPFSSGEGMEICQAVGVALSKSGWSTFSGSPCALTATPTLAADTEAMLKMWKETSPEHWTDRYSQGRLGAPSWISTFPQYTSGPGTNPSPGILVNNQGERFIDEASPITARYPRVAQILARQYRGFAWLIGDKAIHDASPGSEASIKRIIAEGGVLGTNGNVIIANSMEEFANALANAGVFKGAFLKTIQEYNKAVDEGKQELLPVPHFTGGGSGGFAIRTPPFYAIPVRAMMYLCFGGVRMNADGQALDAQGAPVPNLYVPPPLGGGFQNEIYTGSIGSAGVFGFRAARHALNALRTESQGGLSKRQS